MRSTRNVLIIAFSLSWVFSQAFADVAHRPRAELSDRFVGEVAEAQIAVFPTIVRTPDGTLYSSESQQRVMQYLAANDFGLAQAADTRFERGVLKHHAQWGIFLRSQRAIGDQLTAYAGKGDYVFVLEILVPTIAERMQVFGIHCFILDRSGTNAFSFLLNSHHELFADAGLYAADATAQARDRLVLRSTDVALGALGMQIDAARKQVASGGYTRSAKVLWGVLEDFQSALPAGDDTRGRPLGFLTFSDADSTVAIKTTTTHPAMPGEAEDNQVLQLDLDVTGWAGFLHLFANQAMDTWTARDWSNFAGFSFWLHGNNSGKQLFVDVLDNRASGSMTDDAERYTYTFVDDFSGWKPVAVLFSDMVRKEIGNWAPNDGLGLRKVHGWAFGTLATDGPATFYIDDFELRSVPVPDPKLSARKKYRLNELPMYGERKKSRRQKKADERFVKTVVPRFETPAEASEYFARRGWNVYYAGNRSEAIKRFNQAWLLDPANQHALWGFAVISMERNQVESALRFYDMAVAVGPENSTLQSEYEYVRMLFAD